MKLFLVNIFILSLFFSCSQEINEDNGSIIDNFNSYDVVNDSLFKLEEINIGSKLENPWAIQFINDNEIIVTEKRGNLIYVNLNKNIQHIIKHEIPLVQYGQGGLLDIKFHKDYLYVTFTIQDGNKKFSTAIGRDVPSDSV